MPRINLRQQFVDDPPIPKNTAKVNYYDVQLAGFMLEVRVTGNATYYLRYRDKAGRHRQTRLGDTTTMSVTEARERACALKNKIMTGFDVQEHVDKMKKAPTFAEFVQDHYMPYAKNTKRSWAYDKARIDDKMMRLWRNKLMADFTPSDLLEFQNNLVQQKLKPGSVNRNMALVKHLFHLAERWEIIDRAPTKNIPPLTDHGARERYLTPEELKRLLNALEHCQSPVVPDIIRMLILTGARRSEVSHLPWSELDLEEGLWTLPAARNKSKRQKVLPLSDAAVILLKARQGNSSSYVFPNPKTGKPLVSVHETWNKIRINARLPDLRIHDLRHSFASFLVNAGHSLYEVQRLLGHTDVSTTQRYAHLEKSTLKKATQSIEKLLKST